MGGGASKSSTAYRVWRSQRFAFYHMVASSKKESCTGFKTVAIRKLNEMALEMDNETRAVVSAQAEGIRRLYNNQAAAIQDFVRSKKLEFAPLRNNVAAIQNISRNEAFRRFVADYRRMNRDLQTYKNLLTQKEVVMREIDDQIGRWNRTLALAQYESPGYNVEELLRLTTGYINSQPIDSTAEARRAAGEDFDDAIEMTQTFAIDSNDADERSEMAQLVKLMFSPTEDPPAYAPQQGSAVMNAARPVGVSGVGVGDEDDFYLFASDKSRLSTPLTGNPKRTNLFAAESLF